MNYTHLHSEIYSDLKARNWERQYGRKILIAIITIAIAVPVACLIYNAFYPTNVININHREEALRTALEMK